MSYLDLCDKFSEVRDHWLSTRSFSDEYLSFLLYKSEIDRNYAKGLKKLAKMPIFGMSKGTILPGLNTLQNLCIQHSIQLKILSENLHKDLALTLKQLVTHQDLIIKDKSELAKRVISEREKIIKSHEKAKSNYMKEFKEGHVTDKSLKLEEKYKKCIERLNTCNKLYTENMKLVLSAYQEQEEENSKKIKEVLVKMISYEQTYIDSYRSEFEFLLPAMQSFNPQLDLQKFINDNLTETGVDTVKFMPYLPPTPRQSLNSVNNKEEILQGIIQKCWDGEQLSREEGSKFLWTISDEIGKKSWVQLLSSVRTQGRILIPSSTFEAVGDLMWCVLTSMMENNDYKYARECISLSQVFYTEENNEKKYIQDFLMLHPLWQEEYNWEKLIITAIEQEIEFFIQNKNIGELKSQIIAISQLTWYTHIMAIYNANEEMIARLTARLKGLYNISEGFSLPA